MHSVDNHVRIYGKRSAQAGHFSTRNVVFCVTVLETKRLQNLRSNNDWAVWQQRHIQLYVCFRNSDICL
jgi:hypothetical protein